MTDTLGTSNLKYFPKFDGRTDYRLWAKKARMVVNLSNKDMFDILEGSREPEDVESK